jgi:hypothetical protein
MFRLCRGSPGGSTADGDLPHPAVIIITVIIRLAKNRMRNMAEIFVGYINPHKTVWTYRQFIKLIVQLV